MMLGCLIVRRIEISWAIRPNIESCSVRSISLIATSAPLLLSVAWKTLPDALKYDILTYINTIYYHMIV